MSSVSRRSRAWVITLFVGMMVLWKSRMSETGQYSLPCGHLSQLLHAAQRSFRSTNRLHARDRLPNRSLLKSVPVRSSKVVKLPALWANGVGMNCSLLPFHEKLKSRSSTLRSRAFISRSM